RGNPTASEETDREQQTRWKCSGPRWDQQSLETRPAQLRQRGESQQCQERVSSIKMRQHLTRSRRKFVIKEEHFFFYFALVGFSPSTASIRPVFPFSAR